MDALAPVLLTLALLLKVPSPSPSPSPSPNPPAPVKGVVILFLIDNSASLPPLDPDEKRVVALEKMFSFLQGRPYRLVLFGGRRELFVDDPARYRNNGQWTDFYFAFVKARELMAQYPKGTDFRMVLLTDAIVDPDPSDWQDQDMPSGSDLKFFSGQKTIDLVREMQTPLYVILVGSLPKVTDSHGIEQAPGLVLDLVRAANGAAASPTAQSLASFFKDDGVLLKKFVFRVEPREGLKKVEPIVRRIAAPSRPTVELQFMSVLILPLALFLMLFLGILVRSFPGAGDLEIVEMAQGTPVHVAADRLHKLESGGWAARGLSLVGQSKDASVTLLYQAPEVELSGAGLDPSAADELTRRLLPLGLEQLRKTVAELSGEGSKEEKIFALNLEYIAHNLDSKEAEERITLSVPARRRLAPIDFLRAKVHLLGNDVLRRSLTEPRVYAITPGREGDRRELVPGAVFHIGPYRYRIKDISKGGRKDARLVLYYDRVPSLLGLKSWLPDALQRTFRLRRRSQRVVC
jgi:hypothetical protein